MIRLDDPLLFEEFFKSHFAELRPNSGELCVIGFDGVIGSGKSTVASAIAESTGLAIASNDKIRRFLNSKGYENDAEIQSTVQFIAERTTEQLLGKGVSHIIDADIIAFYDYAKRRIEKMGARLYIVEVDCPEELIRERITARLENSTGDSRAGLQEFERRKAIRGQFVKPRSDFIVHTNESLDSQVRKLVAQLGLDGES